MKRIAHAEVCPVCKGEGKVGTLFDFETGAIVKSGKRCNGCSGKGWVQVTDTYPKSLK